MQRLIGSDAGLQMPPTGAPDAIDVLRAWIDSGTDMPGRAAETAVVERKTEPRRSSSTPSPCTIRTPCARRSRRPDAGASERRIGIHGADVQRLRRNGRQHGGAARRGRGGEWQEPAQCDCTALGHFGSGKGEAPSDEGRRHQRQIGRRPNCDRSTLRPVDAR